MFSYSMASRPVVMQCRRCDVQWEATAGDPTRQCWLCGRYSGRGEATWSTNLSSDTMPPDGSPP